MAVAMAVQVTIYLNEADQWHHRPLHLEILNYLRKENVYAATAVHAVAGFLGRHRVETAHLIETGGKLAELDGFGAQAETLKTLARFLVEREK